MVWPACGFVSGLPIKLYTTLDNAAEIKNPMKGAGPGTAVPDDDFKSAQCGNGLLIDAGAEHVEYPMAPNLNLNAGTIDFWYMPDDLHTDGLVHNLFATGDVDSKGGIKLTKTASNLLQFTLVNSSLIAHPTSIGPSDYAFKVGSLIRITIAWSSNTSPPGAPAVRIWLDKVEAKKFAEGPAKYPLSMSGISTAGSIFLGALGANDATPANGIIDDFKIYGAALAPL